MSTGKNLLPDDSIILIVKTPQGMQIQEYVVIQDDKGLSIVPIGSHRRKTTVCLIEGQTATVVSVENEDAPTPLAT